MNPISKNLSLSMEDCRERRQQRMSKRRASVSRALTAQLPTLGDPLDLSLSLHPFRPMPMPMPIPTPMPMRMPMPMSINPTHHYLSSSSYSGQHRTTLQFLPETVPSPKQVYGLLSLSGRSTEMEDTVSVVLNLCSPPFIRGKYLHFFGVFDGHGGHQVSELCRDTMHVLMAEELMRMKGMFGCSSSSRSRKGKEIHVELEDMPWRMAIKNCFERMDQAAMSFCYCGNSVDRCSCHSIEMSVTGSTAVVAMLTPDFVVVANCGDSRAVLCRAGKCEPLSYDHKPNRADESARIKAAGGRVLFSGGAKVEGILAVSRAIGDKRLKKVVISEPEIRFMRRHPNDECLILASDGLWNVISGDLACEVARKCLLDGVENVYLGENTCQPMVNSSETDLIYPSSSAFAAAILTRLALSRNSGDNISVIVVDLRG